MLQTLSAKHPLVYVYLTPLKHIYNKGKAWKKASAVILGHSGSTTVQHFVADVLVGRAEAVGRLSVEVQGYRKPGDGIVGGLEQTKVYNPKDYGMDSAVLAKIDDVVLEGIRAKAYPGCQVLILKDGVPVYDKCFGHFTYGGTREVNHDDLYDIASLTKTTATDAL